MLLRWKHLSRWILEHERLKLSARTEQCVHVTLQLIIKGIVSEPGPNHGVYLAMSVKRQNGEFRGKIQLLVDGHGLHCEGLATGKGKDGQEVNRRRNHG